METIVTLLFILLPVIFKLIGKKFEQAGQPEKAEKVRELMKTIGGDSDDAEDPFSGLFGRNVETEVERDDEDHIVEVKPEPQPAPKKPILKEEVKTKSGEKIDPKKLVIYSEIMKPKYTE